MTPSQRAHVRAEVLEYVTLCRRMGYVPTQEDLRDVVSFCLSSSGTSTMCESEALSSAHDLLLEKKGSYGSSDSNPFDFEFSSDSKGGGTLSKAVAFIFKKPRVASLLKQEMKAEFGKLELFKKEVALMRKIAELEGREDDVQLDYPKMTK